MQDQTTTDRRAAVAHTLTGARALADAVEDQLRRDGGVTLQPPLDPDADLTLCHASAMASLIPLLVAELRMRGFEPMAAYVLGDSIAVDDPDAAVMPGGHWRIQAIDRLPGEPA
jgi:hypothetical protein